MIVFNVGFASDAKTIFLNNLPPSHVACTTEVMQATITIGGTMIVMDFDPKRCLAAIQELKVTHIAGIPALFTMLWRYPDYKKYDLSSLKVSGYAGQAVPRPWAEQLQAMTPHMCTGLAMTEMAGVATTTNVPCTVDDLMNGVGYYLPSTPVTIREAMNPDGTAGKEKPAGEVGEICFQGPQVFLGYLNDPENTAKSISSEGVLYTGDLGSYDDKGLHFAGRRKFVIKPKGYQVFPSDVEEHIAKSLQGKIGSIAVIGAEHDIFTEGIMAFAEVPDGVAHNSRRHPRCLQGYFLLFAAFPCGNHQGRRHAPHPDGQDGLPGPQGAGGRTGERSFAWKESGTADPVESPQSFACRSICRALKIKVTVPFIFKLT